MYRCSAAACGVPLEMIWTRYWSTVFYLSSTLEIGSCSHMLAPTVWVNHCAPPLTHHHPLCTTSSPLETGKFGSDGENLFCARMWRLWSLIPVYFHSPGLRCRTLVLPTRLCLRTSPWSRTSSIPAKQRLHCRSQLRKHLTGTRSLFTFLTCFCC